MKPGAGNDGYWTLAHAVIQFENFADCCEVMWPGKDVLVSYDNSQNHRGKRSNGLDVKRMNKEFGGAQHDMRASTIMESVLGEYANGGNRLEAEASQLMNFAEGDIGPYYYSEAERELRRSDFHPEGQYKNHKLTKKELADALIEALDSPPENLDKKSLVHLRLLAQRHGIAPEITIPKIKEGWMGKPKGLLQICYERGLIDGSLHKSAYSKAQLQEILLDCDDFKNEISLLEWVGKERGIEIIFSAKAYPDDAGFGIEYNWAVAKNKLSAMPLSERKGAEKFKKAFEHCFSDLVLTKKAVRGCARKARQFQLAYVVAAATSEKRDLDGPVSVDELSKCVDPVSYDRIEKMRRDVKTHRSVADINGQEIRFILDETSD
jgi:hypothetical protein